MRKLSTLVPFGHRRRSRRCSLESFQNCNSKLFCLNITKIKYSLEAFQDSNFQECESKQFCLCITKIRFSILFYLSRGEESVPQTPFRIAFIHCFILNILFGKIGIVVNYIIEKLKSKHNVCLSFLWRQVFLRERKKIFYTYSGPLA